MSFKISNILDYDSFLALDIGSFKIKVLACKIEGQELKIVGSSSLRQSKKDMFDGEITDMGSISKSINKAITKACQSIDKIPEDIIVLYNSSELIYDFTSVNYVRKGKEQPISMKEIDDMIEDVEYRSLDKLRSKTENRLGIIEAEMKLLTTSITGIYVDGQRVSNPIGFGGKNIKFNLINIFCPVSRFFTLKNVIRDLNLNLISIVPLAISLPKLIEETSYNYDANIFIDFGYSKTTVILQNNSEVLGFNILNIGMSLIEDELKNSLGKSYLDIEKLISELDEKYEENKNVLDEIFDFIFDSIIVAIGDIEKSFFAKNIFFSGAGICEVFKNKLIKHFEENNIGKSILGLDKYLQGDDFKEYNNNALLPVFSLAKAGKEMMAVKKDPLVRILRYVIYKYE